VVACAEVGVRKGLAGDRRRRNIRRARSWAATQAPLASQRAGTFEPSVARFWTVRVGYKEGRRPVRHRLAGVAGEEVGQMKKIYGKARSVRELLKDRRYSIDYYQREYKWHEKQVQELVEDLTDRFSEDYRPGDPWNKVLTYGHYFLGAVIISDKEGTKYIVCPQTAQVPDDIMPK